MAKGAPAAPPLPPTQPPPPVRQQSARAERRERLRVPASCHVDLTRELGELTGFPRIAGGIGDHPGRLVCLSRIQQQFGEHTGSREIPRATSENLPQTFPRPATGSR